MEKDIKSLIKDKGFRSSMAFASESGVSYTTLVSAISSVDKLVNTSHQNFRAIANTLGMTCDELWDWLHSDN